MQNKLVSSDENPIDQVGLIQMTEWVETSAQRTVQCVEWSVVSVSQWSQVLWEM